MLTDDKNNFLRPVICNLLADDKKNFLQPVPAKSRSRRLTASELTDLKIWDTLLGGERKAILRAHKKRMSRDLRKRYS